MASHGENNTSSETFNSAYWVAEICIAFFATISNLVVLIAFCTNEKLRTIPNWYIASLSVSDLLMGTFGIPFILIALTGNPKNNYGLCISAVTAIVWIEVCSCFTLFALSFDRYYAVCRPLEYTRKMSQRRALFLIMLAWLTPLLYSLLIPIVWHSGPMDDCIFIRVVDLHSLMYAYLAFFLPMFGIECVMYYKIFQAIRNQLKRLSHIQQVGIRLHLTSVHDSTNDVNLTTPSPGPNKNILDERRRISKETLKYICHKQNDSADQIAVDRVTMASALLDQNSVQSRTKELSKTKAKEYVKCNKKVIDDLNVFGKELPRVYRTSSCPELQSKGTQRPRLFLAEDHDINDNKMESLKLTQHPTTQSETTAGEHSISWDVNFKNKNISTNKICHSTSVPNEMAEPKTEDFSVKRSESNTRLVASGTVNHIQSSRYRQERRTAILFVFILLFFFASWSPVYIIDICLVYNIKVNQGLVNFAVLLSHFNSAFNPILYAYKKEFRNVLKSWTRSLQRLISSKCTKSQQNQIHPSSFW